MPLFGFDILLEVCIMTFLVSQLILAIAPEDFVYFLQIVFAPFFCAPNYLMV